MLINRDFVGYMATEVIKKITEAELVEIKNAPAVTLQLRQAMMDEITVEDRINEEARDILDAAPGRHAKHRRLVSGNVQESEIAAGARPQTDSTVAQERSSANELRANSKRAKNCRELKTKCKFVTQKFCNHWERPGMRISREKIVRLSHKMMDVLVASDDVEFIEDRDTIRQQIVNLV